MLITRTFTAALELREEGEGPAGDGRTLIGLAVPFDTEIDVSDFWEDYTEVFRRGAFSKTITDRSRPVPLLAHHQHRAAGIGRAVRLEETQAGLEAEFHLTEGVQAADETLALVLDDAIGGLSIGFEPINHRETRGTEREPPSDRDLIERTEVALREISVVNFPAFAGAGITGVRHQAGGRPSLTALAAERGRLEGVRSRALDRWGRVVRT